MKQQTAVEWLVEQLANQGRFASLSYKMYEQAKVMEKEQIMNAHWQGFKSFGSDNKTSEQYYNETYNKTFKTNTNED